MFVKIPKFVRISLKWSIFGFSKGEFEGWVVTVVGEERSECGGRMRGVVVGEFSDRKECGPVVLVVVREDSEVLFEDLVESFGLSISFWMVGSREVLGDLESFGDSREEMRGEFGSTI